MFRYSLIVFFLFHFLFANAEDWPTKPITLLIPLPAGGGTDAVYRILGKEMSGILGQPIIVDNRPGAAGRIGATEPPAGTGRSECRTRPRRKRRLLNTRKTWPSWPFFLGDLRSLELRPPSRRPDG